MARLTGPLDIQGSLSHLSFYRVRGSDQTFVREKRGPTKEQIHYDPRFAGTRRNCTEWDGCTKGSKWIRRALHPLCVVRDYNWAGPLTGLLKAVQQRDTEGVYGQRSVWLSQHGPLLEGFTLSRQTPFDSLVRTPLEYSLGKDTLSACVAVPVLVPGVNFVPRNSHPYFRLVASLGVVPDLHYSPHGYTPDVPTGHYLPQVASTEWRTVKSGATPTVLELQLPYTVEYPSFSLVLSVALSLGTPDGQGQVAAVRYTGSGRIVAVV